MASMHDWREALSGWGWPLAFILSLAWDGVVLEHLLLHSNPNPIIPWRFILMVLAAALMGTLAWRYRLRWLWGVAGVLVFWWSITLDLTGLSLWIWMAGWRRAPQKPFATAGLWAAIGYGLHAALQWTVLPFPPYQPHPAALIWVVLALGLTGLVPTLMLLASNPNPHPPGLNQSGAGS